MSNVNTERQKPHIGWFGSSNLGYFWVMICAWSLDRNSASPKHGSICHSWDENHARIGLMIIIIQLSQVWHIHVNQPIDVPLIGGTSCQAVARYEENWEQNAIFRRILIKQMWYQVGILSDGSKLWVDLPEVQAGTATPILYNHQRGWGIVFYGTILNVYHGIHK